MKILKAKQVAEKTSISIPHIHRLARDGKFPKPIKLTESRSSWLEGDIENGYPYASKDIRERLTKMRYDLANRVENLIKQYVIFDNDLGG